MLAAALVMMPTLSGALVAPWRAGRRALVRTYASASGDAGGGLAPGGDVLGFLRSRTAAALGDAFGAEYGTEACAALSRATKREFGDFQCNAALALGKRLGRQPRELAAEIAAALEADGAAMAVLDGPLEVAGPGFVNLRVGTSYLSATAEAIAGDGARRAVPKAAEAQAVVVDYSSPNIAKEMHVGHLRSTVIGDCLANCLEFRGHKVTRANHVGDWGTQFGMLLAHLDDVAPVTGGATPAIGDLVAFYKAAKGRFDADDAFAARSRALVVALQGGDARALEAWARLCEASRSEFQDIYDRLGVTGLEEVGESFYNDRLAAVVADLEASGLAEVSDGALVVYAADDVAKEKTPTIVRKSDGGFLYATTDLAAASYRARDLGCDRVLYVTDAGQARHFQSVFAIARRASLAPERVSLEHVPFGLVRGEDGKKFATRSGDTVRLKDLLDEAEARARADLDARLEERDEAGDWDDGERAALAKAVGVGAVKYADLSLNRESNYKFSYAKMLALSGNTAPFMLYSYARIRGIRDKCGAAGSEPGAIELTERDEIELARHLALLATAIVDLERDLRPNALCDYLFELAQYFNRFYETCPVANADTAEERGSRAALCAATAGALELGLGILGIPLVDRL